MKKLVSLILALVLICGASAAMADRTVIDGLSERNITINPAGLNPSAEEMILAGYSPTTGRLLEEIEFPDGFVGTAVSGKYQPIMVQISNSNNGIGVSESGRYYITAPINGTYADVVYEAPQKRGGSQTRFSMIFSDTVPDYVGFVRSTRLTHCRLRQEWDCAFCTSGYSSKDVPNEWAKLGVKNPEGAKPDDPGLVYVGDYPKVWKEYVWRLSGIASADSELFMTANIVQNIVPKDHVPANHTWKFTDEKPTGGDPAEFVYVIFGNGIDSDSRLEYSAEDNAYIRYVSVSKTMDMPNMDVTLINPTVKTVKTAEGEKVKKIVAEGRPENQLFKFNNVIVQSVKIDWPSGLRPDPVLVGTGNADYFMGGQHFAGVWQRTDVNSRTVFYDQNGNEIQLQRGKTLIVLLDYTETHSGGTKTAGVQYE